MWRFGASDGQGFLLALAPGPQIVQDMQRQMFDMGASTYLGGGNLTPLRDPKKMKSLGGGDTRWRTKFSIHSNPARMAAAVV